jgi:C-terminal processing protease CtpA/Prc
MAELNRRSVLARAAATAAAAIVPASPTVAVSAFPPCPTRSLKNFLADAEAQALASQYWTPIVDQAIELLASFYVHLPLKRLMYGVDPIERLRRLRHALPQMKTDRSFHAEMMAIFESLHDLHTAYLLPEPYASAHASLPFKIRACVDGGRRKYIVSRVAHWFTHPTFRPGVDVVSCNGVPVEQAARKIGGQGSNPAAQLALGLAHLTYRPLRWQPPPDDDAMIVRYAVDGCEQDIAMNWQVTIQPDPGLATINPRAGIDIEQLQEFRRFLYAPYNFTDQFGVPELISTADGTFGYIRIFSFERFDSDDLFVARFKALVAAFADTTKGLIIDVRDNGGGSTRACERILQFITPTGGRIEPSRVYFKSTPETLRFCKLGKPVGDLGPQGLVPWITSIERALQTGAPFSDSFEYTSIEACNEPDRRVYPNPVIVLTSALTYSAAEMFAAGFQDHGGMVLGVDETTGGGGAGVRHDFELRSYFLSANQQPSLADLPGQVGFRVAFRRSVRVGLGAGKHIEDAGVRRDIAYAMTRNDVLNNDEDMKKEAARVLAQMPAREAVRASA